jgi:hypothetical protein
MTSGNALPFSDDIPAFAPAFRLSPDATKLSIWDEGDTPFDVEGEVISHTEITPSEVFETIAYLDTVRQGLEDIGPGTVFSLSTTPRLARMTVTGLPRRLWPRLFKVSRGRGVYWGTRVFILSRSKAK